MEENNTESSAISRIVTTSLHLFESIFSEIVTNPINLILVTICGVILYKMLKKERPIEPPPRPPELPPLKKMDMNLEELGKYDGRGPDGRVCVAVNGKVFDVTKGKRFYGPGGPYSAFAGHDASRGLATFSVEVTTDKYDDLSDLNSMQMESVREWEIQFTERYHYVGRLLKPGEEPTDYSDEEETSQDQSVKEKDKLQSEEASGDIKKPTT